MKRYATALALVIIGGVMYAAGTTYDVAVQTRDCISSLPLQNNANNRAKKAQCVSLADQVVAALTPPPPQQEVCGDGIDNDGDGLIDEGCAPPPVEVCGNGIDDDGDGLIDENCPPPASGPAYYVATNGSDNNTCSLVSPCRSILHGVTKLSAGNTLYIRGGTYEESLTPVSVWIPSGTSWTNAITIAGYPGEAAILRHINIQDNVDGSVVSYLIFDNLVIDAGGSASSITNTGNAFRTAGNTHHVRLSNSEVRNANDNLIFSTETASYIELVHNNVHHAFVSLFGGAHPTTANYGLYVKFHNSLVDANFVHDITGTAIHLYGSGLSSVSNNVIRGNLVTSSATNDGERGNLMDVVLIASGTNNLVYNNLIYQNTGAFAATGISMGYGASNSQIFNNTVVGNPNAFGIQVNANCPNTVIRNNIVYQNSAAIVDWGASGTVQSNNLTTSPGFVNAASGDYHLLSGSPAINAGMTIAVVTNDLDGVSRPQGSAYDIGAYEFR